MSDTGTGSAGAGATATAWLETLSPWPEEFGLGRMRALLAELGDPQLAYPSIHVVGTNGKSTTAWLTANLLDACGFRAGVYLSPHVRGWGERIQVIEDEVRFEDAVERVRPAAEAVAATQFEVLTAAGLAEFAERAVDVAVVEAGLGGRLDATNVLRSPVQVLTNVALDHTDVLGGTREEIAREKLAVVQAGATVVLGEPEWQQLAQANGAGRVVVAGTDSSSLGRAAAEAFMGEELPEGAAAFENLEPLPGRGTLYAEEPLEFWDGAHNPAGAEYLRERYLQRPLVIVASILADKAVDELLDILSGLSSVFVATTSTNPRALSAAELAGRAAAHFSQVEAIEDPLAARERARGLAGRDGAVLVTGSLYLLADLSVRLEGVRWDSLASG